jgi:deazaflavin-dependent oxidoreductase (nitroreductase family)
MAEPGRANMSDWNANVITEFRANEGRVGGNFAGAPTDPDWYRNLVAAGRGAVERGTETYDVEVRELTGAERDDRFAEQARRYPGFAEYEKKTAGIRTIPVLELTRVR